MSNAKLPQNDLNPELRKKNLQKNQSKYRYKYDYASLSGIAMADGVPCKELPGFIWIKDVIKTILRLLRNVGTYHFFSRWIFRYSKKQSSNIRSKQPKQMSDYVRYFQTLDIPKITFNYQDDVFARMRVAGQNPLMISAVNAIEPSFPVDNTLFQSIKGFANDTLEKAIDEHRLFIVDYKKLELIKNGTDGHGMQQYNYVPKALFAIPANQSSLKTSLVPIAIQCGQVVSEDMPIYTPNDGMVWNMAKTIIQIADFNYHELISHLAATHLLIEPFVISTHRQLANNHPLKVLLLPHFEGTIFINWAAQKALVNTGGKVDTLFSGTIESSRALVAQRLTLSFNEELFPNKIKKRGVDKPNLIYPYRDDAQKIWLAISEWVDSYLNIYYKNDQDILDDSELSAWAKELTEAGHVLGFGDDNNGKITTLAYLKQAVTMVIFTSSAQHAAVNFSQHDFAGYPPNMPAAGYTPAPQNKNQSTQAWLNILPPINQSAKQAKNLILTKNLLQGIHPFIIINKQARVEKPAFFFIGSNNSLLSVSRAGLFNQKYPEIFRIKALEKENGLFDLVYQSSSTKNILLLLLFSHDFSNEVSLFHG